MGLFLRETKYQVKKLKIKKFLKQILSNVLKTLSFQQKYLKII